MPLGSASAFYGIRGCMTILHGSQGCSTYIRRHMATHYNEPVDIASSSLTEEGTVFGGEKNLIKGLENLIRLYDPEVIGVATTCLAETIGEDVPRIVQDFRDSHPDLRASIITVPAAGYAGTQYEGFFRALRAVVAQTEQDAAPHNGINLITGMISPADTRFLLALLAETGLEATLLPDLSENLDGGHEEAYRNLPSGGTPLAKIARMAGARMSIEIAEFIPPELSPGQYLEENFGVPLRRCALPVGLRDTDRLLALLEEAGGRITPALQKQRRRYLDAMADSHKYNALVRAAVFGEPDFVYAVSRLCVENGALPVLTATGASSPLWQEKLREEVAPAAAYHMEENCTALDNCDFDLLEEQARLLGVNVLIGSSDGRRAEEHLDIPLVRCAFPCHDFVGGQRQRMLGYEGGLAFLDSVTNAVIHSRGRRYRGELFSKYYHKAVPPSPAPAPGPAPEPATNRREANASKSAVHPCFNGGGGDYAMMHLPVAPACNIQCRYCLRKFDCPNESRPGVTSEVLSPREGYEKFLAVKARMPELTTVGIAGPGDALADFAAVRETLRLIRAADPDITFCLSTNGLLLPLYAEELVEIGVSHVTVTVNALTPQMGARIYAHVDYLGENYTGEAGAAILLANQFAGLRRAAALGMVCKVNIVLLRGINDEAVRDITEKAKAHGASIANIMQMIPVPGTEFAGMEMVSHKDVQAIRRSCGEILPQMYHCRQCRADAIGKLGEDRSLYFRKVAALPAGADKTAGVLRFAVTSRGGMLVDQHFGQANEIYIYDYADGRVCYRERRGVVGTGGCGGAGGGKAAAEELSAKMEALMRAVDDCDAVLTMRVGEASRERLRAKGIDVRLTYDRIEDAVRDAGQASPGR
jgi:nitrogenase molybdenum-iron protein alpha/beta subunit/MoaA/NifB/PqqE/SkfB family radical SAM enzyme